MEELCMPNHEVFGVEKAIYFSEIIVLADF